MRANVLNKAPTVLRAPAGLGDYLKRDGMDVVPYLSGPKIKHTVVKVLPTMARR